MNTAARILPVAILTVLMALPSTVSYAQSKQPPIVELASDAPQLMLPAANADAYAVTRQTRDANVAYVDVQSRSAVALFFRNDYESTSEAILTWTGNVASCMPGTTPSTYRDALLRRIKYFRSMAGVPVTLSFSDTMNASAQRAALMMSANTALSHSPPSSWACHSSEGAQAAGKSNLALGYTGVYAIDGYMQEPGTNNGPVGHRRWLLYPQTLSIGTGDVPPNGAFRPANALTIIDNKYGTARPATRDGFVAWPPPGFVPYQVAYARWSFAYPGADFSAATVTLTSEGQAVAVTKESVATGYGENAMVWLINGMGTYDDWALPTHDTPYQVHIDNVRIAGQNQSFDYTVTIFDPANATPTDIVWSPNSVQENATTGTVYGNLDSVDPDVDDAHTYALVVGEGDTDNDHFSVNDNTLMGAAVLDYEAKSTYSVRVQTTDLHGAQFAKTISITIGNINEAPSDVYLAQAVLQGSINIGTNVGDLYVVDDAGDSDTFALVAGSGDDDNASFMIQGNVLKINGELRAPVKAFYRVRVQVTDSAGNVLTKALLILGQPTQMFMPLIGR